MKNTMKTGWCSLSLRLLYVAVLLAAAACGGGGGSSGEQDGAAPDAAADAAGQEAVAADAADVAPDLGVEDRVVPTEVPTPDVPPDEGPQNQCDPPCDFAAGMFCNQLTWGCEKMVCDSCVKNLQCAPDGWCLDYDFPGVGVGGVCTADCAADTDCAAGFSCDDLGYCVPSANCIPETCGSGELGAPCAYAGDVNSACGDCKEGLVCLGYKPQPKYACESEKDCAMIGLPIAENPDCVDKRCGGSYCAPQCDENKECQEGFTAVTSGTQCYCLIQDIGTAKAGEACHFSQVNFEADSCEADLWCLGIAPGEDSLMCGQDADCAKGWYPGGPACIEGRCAASFCSPKCLEDGTCEEGYIPIDVSDLCYCLPVETGDGKLGEPCPFGNVNADFPACAEELACVGLPAFDWTAECTAAGDCPATFVGNVKCFMGHCASSSCAQECDVDGSCPKDYVPWLLDGANCYCVGPDQDSGASEAGEACGFFNVNVDAGACSDGLACMGMLAAEAEEQACVTAADCDPDTNPGVIDCVNGYCGSSFCAPMCDADGACPDGFLPAEGVAEEGEEPQCWCFAVPVGETPAGGPCPFDTVYEDADYCLPGLACLGIPADETGALCEKDADCAPDPYLGNGTCLDGHCGTSICSAKCTAGACPEGEEPLVLDFGCYCLPKDIGTAEEGDACPLFNGNFDAEACLGELDCIGLGATQDMPACEKDADCPEVLPGDAFCFLGHCGSSLCAARCDDEGECPAGSAAAFVGGRCHCLAGQPGNSDAGDGCPFLGVNDKLAQCKKGLACTGVTPYGTDECDVADDCSPEDYLGQAVCLDGHCAASFCAPACDADDKCQEGWEPMEGAQDCYCAPVSE